MLPYLASATPKQHKIKPSYLQTYSFFRNLTCEYWTVM